MSQIFNKDMEQAAKNLGIQCSHFLKNPSILPQTELSKGNNPECHR